MLFNFYRSSLCFVRSPMRSQIRKTSSISISQHDCFQCEAWGRCIRKRRISLRGWKTAQSCKKKKKKVESYMSPFHGLPRPLLQRHPLTCCSIYPQSGQKREENASSPRRKNALFIHRVYSFLCCKLVTVPVNSATANKAWWNNCRLVLRDKRVDRLTRLLLQTFSHH